MDKIQELHGKLFLHEQSIGEYMKDHATITEDLMGRFAEWVFINNWGYNETSWEWFYLDFPLTRKTTSELITMFKATL